MAIEDSIRRADREALIGKLWRAKEILQGNLGRVGYDPKLYAAYGRLLLKMSDHREAGCYLALSGDWSGDAEQQAVELFVQLARNRDRGMLWSSLPGGFRQVREDSLPDRVREILQQLNVADRVRVSSLDQPEPSNATWRDTGCLLIVAVICTFIGIMTLTGIAFYIHLVFWS